MKTALEMLHDHRMTFWHQTDNAGCDRYMAKEAQLKSHAARQTGNPYGPWVYNQELYARQMMGITNADQFYA